MVKSQGGRPPELPAGDRGSTSDSAVRSGLAYLPWLAPLWVAGVLVFQVRALMAWIGAQRLRTTGVCAAPDIWRSQLQQLSERIGLKGRVALLESCIAEFPALIGYVRPMILIPVGVLAGLPAHQVEAILLHELAHIRRHDYLANLLQMFGEGLFFYHPAVWWISWVIRTEREDCCDDVVVATQKDAYGYASALTTLESRRMTADHVAVAATGGDLVKRIRRLLAIPEGPRAGMTPVLSVVVLTITPVGVVAAWQTKPAVSVPVPTVSSVPAVPLVQGPLKSSQTPVKIAQSQAQRVVRSAELQDAPPITKPSPYNMWLQQDVAYIITDEERAVYKNLQTDEEREHFIEQFWQRRDPTPGTDYNEFKAEHYRRIAYANEQFTFHDLPGWKTDRGRIYIRYGAPDEKESHPSGGSYTRPTNQGGGVTTTYPFEQWWFRWIQGVGNDVIVEFVDPTMTGEYRMTMDPSEKDALRLMKPPNIPGEQVRKAGATVRPAGNGGVMINVPLDPFTTNSLRVSVCVTTMSNRVVKNAVERPVRGQAAFAEFLALPSGAYRLEVSVKDVSNAVIATDEFTFEVK
jgi:GWxTD domain-containing protein